MRTFSRTESLVIDELSKLGVTVNRDENTLEYYMLECEKDGLRTYLYHGDIDGLFNLNDEKVRLFCEKLAKDITAKKPEIVYPVSDSEF